MKNPNALAKKVLLVGWDGADWQLIHPLMDAGKMPNTRRIVEQGVAGNILTLQPVLSPILWTSITTGKRAYQHGIHGFVEPTPDGAGLRPVSSSSRTAKALWNILSQAGLRCHAVGWYASHPAETIRGTCVSNQFAVAPPDVRPDSWPIASGSVEPASVGETLADLRVHSDEILTEFVANFIPAAERLSTTRPAVAYLVAHLKKRLAELLTTHAVVTELMEQQPWDFCTVYYEAIDQLGHDFMLYHPPRMEHLPVEVFEAFKHVMAKLYELHDAMLGRLLELAGDDAHVIILSDHGFLNDHRRPVEQVEPARWHRNLGVVAMSGPGLKRDELVQGATLLDVAPTILTLFGLPVGQDMEGKVLINAFEDVPSIERIASWETVDGEFDGKRALSTEEDPAVAAEAMRQLVELGYLEAPGEDTLRNIARARAEQRYNLAAALLEGKRSTEALAIARTLSHEFPDEIRHALLLGQAAVPIADAAALAEAIAAVERIDPVNRQINLFRGFLSMIQDDPQQGLAHFLAAAEQSPDDAWVHNRVGRACLRLRRWAEAEKAFNRAASLDKENAESSYGLSVAVARLGRPEEAVEHGLRAVGQLHDFPLAHFQLGAVLSRLAMFDRAAQAFEICVAMRPNFALAYRYLSRVYHRLGKVMESKHAHDTCARLLMTKVPQPTVD
ncbi:MAG TPA: alkaline phosphatase family protein [Tepidisphaeraceae bacterium]|nr:alkaline phosphatase family protein [Tepidisphaeraceae bacterium]